MEEEAQDGRQPFSNWLEFPGESKGKKKLDGLPRVPGREEGRLIFLKILLWSSPAPGASQL